MSKLTRIVGIALGLCILIGTSTAWAESPGPVGEGRVTGEWTGEFDDLVPVLKDQRAAIAELRQLIHDANRELATQLLALRRERNLPLLRQIHALRGDNLELRVDLAELVLVRHGAWGTVMEGHELEDPDLIRTGLEQVIAINENLLELLAEILGNVQAMLDLLP